jgi:hypothetical protein
MIVDHIDNVDWYAKFPPAMAAGPRFLADFDSAQFAVHVEVINDGAMRTIFEAYDTKPGDGLLFEAHDRVRLHK